MASAWRGGAAALAPGVLFGDKGRPSRRCPRGTERGPAAAAAAVREPEAVPQRHLPGRAGQGRAGPAAPPAPASAPLTSDSSAPRRTLLPFLFVFVCLALVFWKCPPLTQEDEVQWMEICAQMRHSCHFLTRLHP